MEKYFYPEIERNTSEERERVNLKSSICPEEYLTIIESTIDGAIKLKGKE